MAQIVAFSEASMASIVNDPNGRRRIQFVSPDGKRKTIRLGKIDRKTAEAFADTSRPCW
jgi:hypothetical protein